MLTMNTHNIPHPNLNVHPPSYDLFLDDPTATMLSALSRYLPSNGEEADDYDVPVDAFSCDNFRMYEFKVRRCARARSHDWTECPFAHPGEKARRRDPRKHRYSGSPCPDYRKGTCHKGDTCEHAHGVFECWLHPSRYRTQPCKDGTHCHRRVCFFAHTPEQIRVESGSGLPRPDPDSPPLSPIGLSDLAQQMRNLRVGGWGTNQGSPRGTAVGLNLFSPARPGYGNGLFDVCEESLEEEPVMERVESGRVLRAQMYAKLSRENSLGRVDPVGNGSGMGWIMG